MAEFLTSRVERELFLRTLGRGVRFDGRTTARIVDLLQESVVPRGSVLYEEGAHAEFIHYIARGRVELETPGAQPLVYEAPAAVGSLDAMQGVPHSRTAVAVEDLLVLRMSIHDFIDTLEDNFQSAKSMLRFLFGTADTYARDLPCELAYPEAVNSASLSLFEASAEVGLVERLLVLRAVPAFRKVPMQVLVRLDRHTVERRLEPQEAIWPERANHHLWIVSRGQIAARPVDAAPDVEFAGGRLIAPFASLAERDFDYVARATGPAWLLGIPRERFYDVMEDHWDLFRELLSYVAGELARLQRTIADRAAAPTLITNPVLRPR